MKKEQKNEDDQCTALSILLRAARSDDTIEDLLKALTDYSGTEFVRSNIYDCLHDYAIIRQELEMIEERLRGQEVKSRAWESN